MKDVLHLAVVAATAIRIDPHEASRGSPVLYAEDESAARLPQAGDRERRSYDNRQGGKRQEAEIEGPRAGGLVDRVDEDGRSTMKTAAPA